MAAGASFAVKACLCIHRVEEQKVQRGEAFEKGKCLQTHNCWMLSGCRRERCAHFLILYNCQRSYLYFILWPAGMVIDLVVAVLLNRITISGLQYLRA